MAKWALLAAVVILLYSGAGATFQSDELDDEWIGVAPPPTLKRPDVSAASDSNKVEFSLEHAFGSSEFTSAGVFTARLRPSFRGGQALVKLRLSRNPFSEADRREFEDLLKEDGFYTIRVPANPLKPGTATVVSSIKARCLAAADLKERLDIYMDQGNIISVSYSPGAECPYPREAQHISKWLFDTQIVSKSGDQATRTLLVNDFEPSSSEPLGDEAPAPLKKLEEKSFWAKYWMYIIPLGLIVMNAITQVANLQDDQGGQAAQQAAPAARAVTRKR